MAPQSSGQPVALVPLAPPPEPAEASAPPTAHPPTAPPRHLEEEKPSPLAAEDFYQMRADLTKLLITERGFNAGQWCKGCNLQEEEA